MEAETSEYVWSPPVYYTGKEPRLMRSLNLSPDPLFPENFVRLAKWYVILFHTFPRFFKTIFLTYSIYKTGPQMDQ